jgi:hypothetical protein
LVEVLISFLHSAPSRIFWDVAIQSSLEMEIMPMTETALISRFSPSRGDHIRDVDITMSTQQALGTIARRRLVLPKPQKTYVKWYLN